MFSGLLCTRRYLSACWCNLGSSIHVEVLVSGKYTKLASKFVAVSTLLFVVLLVIKYLAFVVGYQLPFLHIHLLQPVYTHVAEEWTLSSIVNYTVKDWGAGEPSHSAFSKLESNWST